MTEENEVLHNKIVKGFAKLIRNATTFDPTLNGHLISFLQSMEALEATASVIREAFDQDRVDLDVIRPEDLEDDDFEAADHEGDEEAD